MLCTFMLLYAISFPTKSKQEEATAIDVDMICLINVAESFTLSLATAAMAGNKKGLENFEYKVYVTQSKLFGVRRVLSHGEKIYMK